MLGSSSSNPLPSYKNPPVNEVVCGMRFHPIEKFYLPHIGLIWDKFRSQYPIIQHATTIASGTGEIYVDNATGLPLPRVFFINKSDDQLVQFQLDRFYFNWRRKQNAYPRYHHLIKHFEQTHSTIVKCVSDLKLGEIKPIEYELSYINQIPKGEGWNSDDDLHKVFTDFRWRRDSGRFLPNPTGIAWSATFPLPDAKGNLKVNLKKAVRAEDKVPLLVLELQARGFDESASKDAFRKWFDVAHEWIVRGFTDLTTQEMQTIWGRE